MQEQREKITLPAAAPLEDYAFDFEEVGRNCVA